MKLRSFYFILFSALTSLCLGLYLGETVNQDCRIHTIIDPATMDLTTLAVLEK